MAGYGGTDGYSSYHAGGGGRDMSNEFSRLAKTISDNIQTITQNVAKVQRMMNLIGTTSDSPKLRDEFHSLEHYTNQLALETKKELTQMIKLPQPASSHEIRQRRLHREKLTEDLMSALNTFQAAVRKASEKEKESLKRTRAHSGIGHHEFHMTESRRSDDQLLQLGNQQDQEVITMEEDATLEVIMEREQAIKKLEADIVAVNEIFKELGTLVHDQGEMIDSIEANVESTSIRVQHGTEQLEQARNYQSKSRRKMFILVGIIVGVLLLIIIIVAGVLGSRS